MRDAGPVIWRLSRQCADCANRSCAFGKLFINDWVVVNTEYQQLRSAIHTFSTQGLLGKSQQSNIRSWVSSDVKRVCFIGKREGKGICRLCVGSDSTYRTMRTSSISILCLKEVLKVRLTSHTQIQS